MIEQDTIKLLRECDAGVQMGVSSIDDVLPHVRDKELKQRLDFAREEHVKLDRGLQAHLKNCHDDGKDPSPMAQGMSWIKTNVKLAVEDSDSTIASLMTDGCNMGIKSLSRYLNQYKAADETSKSIAKHLIALEERMLVDMRRFL